MGEVVPINVAGDKCGVLTYRGVDYIRVDDLVRWLDTTASGVKDPARGILRIVKTEVERAVRGAA